LPKIIQISVHKCLEIFVDFLTNERFLGCAFPSTPPVPTPLIARTRRKFQKLFLSYSINGMQA